MGKKSDIYSMHAKLPRMGLVLSLLVVILLILAACAGAVAPAAPAADAPTAEAVEAAATEPPAEDEATEEVTEEPTEEVMEEATEEPTEEVMEEATEEPTEEAMEEAEPTEEATEEATEEPTEEATEEPAEEPEATGTPEAEEESSLSPEAAAGQYLVTIARGCGCHFNNDLGGYAGGAFSFKPADGVEIYPANITPHEETGIGSWSAEDISVALRTGAKPDGEQLFPIMPYRAFSHLSDEDALNIAAYLLSLEPIENAVPERVIAADPAPFTPDPVPPATAPTDPVERGAYLVQLARCGDCHTPRNEDGSQNTDMLLAGNRISEDEIAWNITPDEATGIGSLTQEEVATFLRTGVLADGSEVAGTMATQIKDYFSKLTEDDAMAIAAYLMSLPPIENDPE